MATWTKILPFAVAWGLGAPFAAGAGTEGNASVGLSVGVDSNPSRDFVQVRDASPDVAFNGTLFARGKWFEGPIELAGEYGAAGRAFAFAGSENTLGQSANASAAGWIAEWLQAGLEGRVRDRRGGDRGYSDLLGGAFVALLPSAPIDFRLYASAHRFVYRPAAVYDFGAPEVGVSARYRFDARHSAFALGELGWRSYGDSARPAPGSAESGDVVEPAARRRDGVVRAQAGYAFKGPFVFSASYVLWSQRSNSFGESIRRHGLWLSGAVRLPWKVTLLGQVSYQLAQYPDGLSLSPELLLLEDNESQNQLSLRLTRPLGSKLDVEATYGLYFTRLPGNGLTYLRQVFGLGVTLRL